MPAPAQLKAEPVKISDQVIANFSSDRELEERNIAALWDDHKLQAGNNWQNNFEANKGINGNPHVQPQLLHNFNRITVHPSRALTIQQKLSVNAPGDEYEQEADAVADKIMRMPDTATAQADSAAVDTLQNKPGNGNGEQEEGKEKEEEPQPVMQKIIQRKFATGEDDHNDDDERSGNKNSGKASPLITPDVQQVIQSPGQPLDLETRSFMEGRFGFDFSNVQIHNNAMAHRSAKDIHALAYTHRHHIAFGAGQYQPQTESGKKLLAHELTHVLQQNNNPGKIQRRRVPGSTELSDALPTSFSDTSMEAEIGLARVLSRAWGELDATQQAAVRTATTALNLTWTNEESLRWALIPVTRATLMSFAQAIRTAAPSAILGDPLLINTGPRTGTLDAANITTLVNNANAVFATLSGSTRNADIGQVFGTANITAAKTKYNNAKLRMNALHTSNRIVTDRSGYNAEVDLGGLTNSNRLSLAPDIIDNPGDNESVITMIHESMHAGNNDVTDHGYIHQPSFTALPESIKLTNAAHFEVVPRRIFGANFAFAGQTFVPAGTSSGGTAAPALTTRQQAIRDASELFREAWTIGLNLHDLFVHLFRTPADWNTLDLSTRFSGAPAGGHFSDTLPFWSKVERLTIHDRATEINPAGLTAFRPVTVIDIALSEGLVRKLAQGMNAVPATEAAAQTFETANATAAEITAAAASSNAERDLLVKLIIRVNLGSITGDVARDERVVAQMGNTANTWTDILAIRSPASFA